MGDGMTTTKATANGIDDPKTGLEGTQPEGNCAWATKEQLGDLLPGSVNGPLRVTLVSWLSLLTLKY